MVEAPDALGQRPFLEASVPDFVHHDTPRTLEDSSTMLYLLHLLKAPPPHPRPIKNFSMMLNLSRSLPPCYAYQDHFQHAKPIKISSTCYANHFDRFHDAATIKTFSTMLRLSRLLIQKLSSLAPAALVRTGAWCPQHTTRSQDIGNTPYAAREWRHMNSVARPRGAQPQICSPGPS